MCNHSSFTVGAKLQVSVFFYFNFNSSDYVGHYFSGTVYLCPFCWWAISTREVDHIDLDSDVISRSVHTKLQVSVCHPLFFYFNFNSSDYVGRYFRCCVATWVNSLAQGGRHKQTSALSLDATPRVCCLPRRAGRTSLPCPVPVMNSLNNENDAEFWQLYCRAVVFIWMFICHNHRSVRTYTEKAWDRLKLIFM